MSKTYDEWNSKGRYILKGSKAVGFNKEGKALFSKDQTSKRYSYDHDIQDGNLHEQDNWNYEDFLIAD